MHPNTSYDASLSLALKPSLAEGKTDMMTGHRDKREAKRKRQRESAEFDG